MSSKAILPGSAGVSGVASRAIDSSGAALRTSVSSTTGSATTDTTGSVSTPCTGGAFLATGAGVFLMTFFTIGHVVLKSPSVDTPSAWTR